MLARLLTLLSFLLCSFASSHAIEPEVGLKIRTSHTRSTLDPRESPLILLDEKTGSYCTAFPISSDGYLMTAAHCLKRCLAERNDPLSTNQKSRQLCSGYTFPKLKTSRIEVVFQGDVLQKKRIETRFGDFAILKIETTEPLSCLSLSETPAKAGDTLEVVGFPMPNDSNQLPELKSNSGKLYASPEESRYYRTRKSNRDRAKIAELYALEDGVLYASAHHSAGQSGGPVLGASGKVIGVVSGFTVTKTGSRWVHEMVAGSTDRILATLPNELSDKLVKKSRDCATRQL